MPNDNSGFPYDILSSDQVCHIINIIIRQCDESARTEIAHKRDISEEIYNKIQKGRKRHKETGDIYLGFFHKDCKIPGIKVELVNNGIYYQPILKSEKCTIHIYHNSNQLNSDLIEKEIKDAVKSGKHFLCMQYQSDYSNHLSRLTVTDMLDRRKETIYQRQSEESSSIAG